MKDWIQAHYSDNLRGYDKLREAINAAQNAVLIASFIKLLKSLPARCSAVVSGELSTHTTILVLETTV
jgi:hypothetical protein